ncbi:hypothetical protein U1Q18_002444 [Sarracenia purpurea var. burkii]
MRLNQKNEDKDLALNPSGSLDSGRRIKIRAAVNSKTGGSGDVNEEAVGAVDLRGDFRSCRRGYFGEDDPISGDIGLGQVGAPPAISAQGRRTLGNFWVIPALCSASSGLGSFWSDAAKKKTNQWRRVEDLIQRRIKGFSGVFPDEKKIVIGEEDWWEAAASGYSLTEVAGVFFFFAEKTSSEKFGLQRKICFQEGIGLLEGFDPVW